VANGFQERFGFGVWHDSLFPFEQFDFADFFPRFKIANDVDCCQPIPNLNGDFCPFQESQAVAPKHATVNCDLAVPHCPNAASYRANAIDASFVLIFHNSGPSIGCGWMNYPFFVVDAKNDHAERDVGHILTFGPWVKFARFTCVSTLADATMDYLHWLHVSLLSWFLVTDSHELLKRGVAGHDRLRPIIGRLGRQIDSVDDFTRFFPISPRGREFLIPLCPLFSVWIRHDLFSG